MIKGEGKKGTYRALPFEKREKEGGIHSRLGFA